jgi:hypothetical protein
MMECHEKILGFDLSVPNLEEELARQVRVGGVLAVYYKKI